MESLLLEAVGIYKRLNPRTGYTSLLDKWLERAEILASAASTLDMNENEASGIWGDHLNREQLLARLAESLAIRFSRDAAYARKLNSFANSRTRISLIGRYLASWRLHTNSLPAAVELLLSERKSKHPFRGLIIGPALGLTAVSLLDLGATLFYTDPPAPFTAEAQLLEENLSRCSGTNRTQYIGRLTARDRGLFVKTTANIDFFFFEGFRFWPQKISAVSTVEQLTEAWRLLRPGGVGIIDGLRFRSNAINAELWPPGLEGGFFTFSEAFANDCVKLRGEDITVLQKTG